MRADQLEAGTVARLRTGESAADKALNGGFGLPGVVVLWGPEGSGKSRAALRWASRAPAGALVVSLEMPLELTRDTAASAGADLSRLHLMGDLGGWQSEVERLGLACVVFDSITVAPRPLAVLGALISWAHEPDSQRLVFVVSHENAKGRATGSGRIRYDPDTTLRLTPKGKAQALVRVRKNRYGARGSFVTRLVA